MERIQNVGEQARSVANNVGERVGQLGETVSSGLSDIRNNLSNAVSGFSSQSVSNGVSEFANSNSIIAKFVFIILVLIVFMFSVSLGVKFLGYVTSPQTNPYLVYGMIPGNVAQTIPQDPRSKEAQTILRSNNKGTGLEFTWSCWLLVTGTNAYSSSSSGVVQYQHVFNKGNNVYDISSGLATTNNGPGMYITNDTNGNINLFIQMDNNTQSSNTRGASSTYNPSTATIKSVPLNKWFHVAIRMENIMLDTYINGTITDRLQLVAVPNQNYYDVQICQNGGFVGNLSNLRYYPSALSAFDINNIVIGGPNTTLSSLVSNSTSSAYPYYFSNMWYTNKI